MVHQHDSRGPLFGFDRCAPSRKLSAVLSRHHTFDVLDDARQKASVVVELLSAIGDLDAAFACRQTRNARSRLHPGSDPTG